jgi:acyl-CoA thioester hydrolase
MGDGGMTKRWFEVETEIRYRDTDTAGHVSSPVYYTYMQTAYLKYMLWLLEHPAGEKLPHIMVKTACEYLRPLKFGDGLRILSSVVRLGSKSFELEYLMHSTDAAQTLVAKGTSTHVMYDYDKEQTMPVPEAFKERVLSFQGVL